MCLMVSQSAEMHSNKYCMWLSFYFQVLSQFEILNNYEIRKIYKVHTSLKWARALLSSEVSSPNLSYPLNKTPTKQSGVKLQHPTVYLHAIPTKSALFFFKTQSIKANGTCTWKCFSMFYFWHTMAYQTVFPSLPGSWLSERHAPQLGIDYTGNSQSQSNVGDPRGTLLQYWGNYGERMNNHM